MIVNKYYIIPAFLFLCLTSLLSAQVYEGFQGSIFPRGESGTYPVYTQKEYTEIHSDTRILIHEYYKEDGTLAAYERVVIRDGEIQLYVSEILDLNLYGEIRRSGTEMIIRQVLEGKEKIKVHDWDNSLSAGPILPGILAENRELLAAGESIEIQFPFFEMQRLIPFRIKRIGGDVQDGQLSVQMKLKNVFLGMLIDPIEFVLDMETGRVLEIHGPTVLPPPGSTKKNDFLDATIYYDYDNAIEVSS